MPTKEQIIEALRRVKDPELHRDLVSLNMIKDVAVCDGHVRVHVELTTPACPLKDTIKADVQREVGKLDGVRQIDLEWSAQVRENRQLRAALPGVKNVIAVGAGKGGVGKSTIAVMLAYGLQRLGARVGLLDADVYGPSIPKMTGVEAGRVAVRDNKMLPVETGGVQVMSTGFLVDPSQASILRGPMISGIVRQFLTDVNWGELDYLIIDLPPGTGDIPLTLAQSLPLTGAVIVATPQEVALLDAIKALRMFQKLNIDILGIVENMSYFVAPDTGREYDLFGRGGAERAAAQLDVPFLGGIPINISIRVSGDAGTPTDIFARTDPATQSAVDSFVRKLAGQVSVHNLSKAPEPELTIS